MKPYSEMKIFLSEKKSRVLGRRSPQYSGEISLAENALNEYAGAMQQLDGKIDEHLAQIQALIGGGQDSGAAGRVGQNPR